MAGTLPRKLNPPFRADHVGSFLRPPALAEARIAAGMEPGSGREHDTAAEDQQAKLRGVEDACIRDVVKLQEGVGIQAITDGEFRRGSWAYDFICAIEGIELRKQDPGTENAFEFTSGARPPIAYAHGKLSRPAGGLLLEDYLFTRDLTDRTVKMTMPSPSLAYVRGGRDGVDKSVYPDLDVFFDDLTGVYREEIAALADAGCRYVQIDNTDTAILCDPKFQDMFRRRGSDPKELLELQARLVSGATRDRGDVTVSMHLCRGNGAGTWLAEGGYDFVADILFNQFDVDAYFMEYDSGRAGDFAPLKYAPDDRLIVLGLLTTKTPENDDKETLKRRIDEAAKYVPLENLALSPQCGFASSGINGNPISADDQKRKLTTIVEVADEVWGTA